MTHRILVVAADAALASTLAAGARTLGHDVVDDAPADIAIVQFDGAAGIERAAIDAAVIAVVDDDDAASVALEAGAVDILRTPVGEIELRARLNVASRLLRAEAALRVDPLTALASHPHIDEHLAMAASAARRRNQPLSLLMIDVDHLSRINGSEGHSAGDAVLRAVARRLKQVLRGEDAAGRWTSDVLVAVAPATDLDGGWRLGERIRLAIAAEPITLPNSSDLVVTVSIGCAAGDGDDVDGQIKRAEAALGQAKSTGRNRVCTDAGLGL